MNRYFIFCILKDTIKHWRLKQIISCYFGRLIHAAWVFKVVWSWAHVCLTLIVAQLVKNLPAVQETQVWFLGWEDPLEKEMATHSSILAWKISWTEGCSPWGRKELGTTERLTLTLIYENPGDLNRECFSPEKIWIFGLREKSQV